MASKDQLPFPTADGLHPSLMTSYVQRPPLEFPLRTTSRIVNNHTRPRSGPSGLTKIPAVEGKPNCCPCVEPAYTNFPGQ